MDKAETSGNSIDRRNLLKGGLAAAAASVLPDAADAQQIDAKIQSLEGYRRNDPQLLISLQLHNKKIQTLVLRYITTFETRKILSQDQMNDDPGLQKIRKEIYAQMNEVAFKKDFIAEMRKTLRKGEKFEFEIHNLDFREIELILSFYHSDTAKNQLALSFNTNGVFATGG